MQLTNSWRSAIALLMLMTTLWITACDQQGAVLPPTEEEQIKNVAVGYFVRETSVPEYEAQVEAVVDDWARVSLAPVGVESSGGPMIMYLQNQAATDNPAPTAVPQTVPGNEARITNDFGWTVITPPQVQFSDTELDAMQVPAKIRPTNG
ncbi:MAG: hypothetical protein R3C14_26370 [Caldilineaceae bacterium]